MLTQFHHVSPRLPGLHVHDMIHHVLVRSPGGVSGTPGTAGKATAPPPSDSISNYWLG